MHYRRMTIAMLSVAALTGLAVQTAIPASASDSPSSQIRNYMGYPTGMCLGISKGADDSPAVLWPCNGKANQDWHWGTEDPSNPGNWPLVNGAGQCLGVNQGSTGQGAAIMGWDCNGKPNQYWEPNGSNPEHAYINIENEGSTLDVGVEGGDNAQGQPLVQWPWQDADNQYWATPQF
jgi:ricin-type beta-trefoil lectin protein